jgi:AMP-polyphosphate phosphotransferase
MKRHIRAPRRAAKEKEEAKVFEAAELGRKVSKKEFDEIAGELRMQLLEAQMKLRGASFPVVVVFAGVDGGGKGETVNLLNEWLDPRWIITRAYEEPSEEERERPEYWRYWRDLPPKGKIGIFLSSWYSRPVLDRVYEKSDQGGFDSVLERIGAFEKELADGGALILKFWMHLGKKAQEKRLRAIESDPLRKWRVTKRDWKNFRNYGKFIAAAEHAILRTSTGRAPWKIVEGADPEFRVLTVATTIRDAIEKYLREDELRKKTKAEPAAPKSGSSPEEKVKVKVKGVSRSFSTKPTILQALDMKQALTRKVYDVSLKKEQARLNLLFRRARERGTSTICVFEGWDAAGKGGVVRRITGALDARGYQVIPIAAPTDEERAQHYLWRFWRHLSRAGRFTIFDRSWYGRLLVERVEGFATEAEWMRAYPEINDFEEQLVLHGIVLCKYWLHITPEEQLKRFKTREGTPYKRWKLTDEDWRNREKWNLYEQAMNDVAERTSTSAAPWTLVEANDKLFARVKVLRTLCDRLEEALKS